MKNKISYLILTLIIILAGFLRLYRISDYMTFLGDEGRDVLIVKGILEGDFTLLGPRSSAGDFYTGPIYYYMIAPFLWLFRLDPVGPAIMIALLGIATVFLIYFVGKKLFNSSVGLMAAALYTVSPLVIAYSRSSWNPNAMPFFTLLILYLLYLGVKNKSWKYFLGVGFLFGIALQLHYIELFIGVVIFCFTFFSFFYLKGKKLFSLFKQYVLLFSGFILGFSPFLAFEVRHNFLNARAIGDFILHGSPNAVDLTHKTYIQIVQDVFFRVFARTLWKFPPPEQIYLFDKNIILWWQIAILIVAFVSIVYLLKYKDRLVATLFGMWLFFGVILFGFYKKPINDYNFEFLFPLPFIITAYFIYRLYSEKRLAFFGKGLAIVLFGFLFSYNLYYLPFRNEPNRQMRQMRTISEFVLSKTDNKPFNFALLTKSNSDHAYRYFFEILKHKAVGLETPTNDPQRKTVTGQLLIVCEEIPCSPLGHPLFDVAGFGRAEIVGEWNMSVVKVYKLIPYKEVAPK